MKAEYKELRNIKDQLNLLADKEYNENGSTQRLEHLENAIKEVLKALISK